MKRLSLNASSWLFVKVIKPVLFLFPPDQVHASFIYCGHILGYLPPARWLMRLAWRYDNQPYLAQVIKGIYFANPIGLSAGFDKNFQLTNVLADIGFGLAEGGSLTRYASRGNPRPHYHRLKKSQSILVYAGLNNDGVNALSQRLKVSLARRKQWLPINISVGYTNIAANKDTDTAIADYSYSLRKLKQTKIGEIITINISCPNVYGGEPFTTPQRLEKLLSAVDVIKLNQPIFLKMPSDKAWPDFQQLIDVALKHGIAGLTICNLAKDRHQAKLQDELTDDVPGNMSGRPVRQLSNDLIHQSYGYCGDKLIIIGAGGVFSASDAYEKIKHGASLVELVTGMIFNGPQLIGQINLGLVELLQKDGYSHISQAVGAYHHTTGTKT